MLLLLIHLVLGSHVAWLYTINLIITGVLCVLVWYAVYECSVRGDNTKQELVLICALQGTVHHLRILCYNASINNAKLTKFPCLCLPVCWLFVCVYVWAWHRPRSVATLSGDGREVQPCGAAGRPDPNAATLLGDTHIRTNKTKYNQWCISVSVKHLPRAPTGLDNVLQAKLWYPTIWQRCKPDTTTSWYLAINKDLTKGSKQDTIQLQLYLQAAKRSLYNFVFWSVNLFLIFLIIKFIMG